MFNVAALAKLAGALIAGDDNVIEQALVKKLTGLGQDFLLGLIKNQLGAGAPTESAIQRIMAGVETGGFSELQNLRSQWLGAGAQLPGTGAAARLAKSLNQNQHFLSRPEGKYQKWSKSRQEWLDQSWKHNWRSQPRDVHGRWIPGRLKHPYISKGTRRMRRTYRKSVRTKARSMVASWGRS